MTSSHDTTNNNNRISNTISDSTKPIFDDQFICSNTNHNTHQTLLSYIQTYNDNITLKQQIDILFKIAQCIQYLHRLHYIYCDITPDNCCLFVDNTTNTISVKLHSNDSITYINNYNNITINNINQGTNEYRSPEQWLHNNNITYYTDIYSFGITMLHIILNDKPFDATSHNAIQLIVTQQDTLFEWLTAISEGLYDVIHDKHTASHLQKLVLLCCEYDPTERINIDTVINKLQSMHNKIDK